MTKAEWKLEPLVNPLNNFFEPLLHKYIDDLHTRHTVSDKSRKTFASVIRRAVTMDTVHDLIEDLYQDTIGQREAAIR